jgi:hypothetical protein
MIYLKYIFIFFILLIFFHFDNSYIKENYDNRILGEDYNISNTYSRRRPQWRLKRKPRNRYYPLYLRSQYNQNKSDIDDNIQSRFISFSHIKNIRDENEERMEMLEKQFSRYDNIYQKVIEDTEKIGGETEEDLKKTREAAASRRRAEETTPQAHPPPQAPPSPQAPPPSQIDPDIALQQLASASQAAMIINLNTTPTVSDFDSTTAAGQASLSQFSAGVADVYGDVPDAGPDIHVGGITIGDCIGSWVDDNNGCSKTCGGGVKTQTYQITTPASGGGSCTQADSSPRNIECNIQPCPVNCVGSWGSFSDCTVDGCSTSNGTKTRTYEITTHKSGGGTDCPHENRHSETESCNVRNLNDCDCEGSWSEFGSCEAIHNRNDNNAPCGYGRKYKRYIVSAPSTGSGRSCEAGDNNQVYEECSTGGGRCDWCRGNYNGTACKR